MRIFAAAALIALLAVVPAGQASCHFCTDQVVEDCTGSDPSPAACADSAAYLAFHYPQHAREHACDEMPDGVNC